MSDNLLYQMLPFESQKIEYKLFLPPPKMLAHDIAAFANTEGGYIIFGVREYEKGTLLLTIYTEEAGFWNELSAKNTTERALTFLKPAPTVKHFFVNIGGERRYVLHILPSSAPVITQVGQYYVRREQGTLLLEENLITALENAVPAITPNILNSLKSGGYNTEKPGSTSDVGMTVHERLEAVPYTKLHELLSESIKRTRDELSMQRKERLQQANVTFIVALIFLILAILLIFTGVILIFTVNLQVGVVTSVSSIISGIVSGLAFTFNKQANDRVDRYAREMIALEKSHTAMAFTAYINDIKMRDIVISDLAKNISSGDLADK